MKQFYISKELSEQSKREVFFKNEREYFIKTRRFLNILLCSVETFYSRML